jgi:hypothetical protein
MISSSKIWSRSEVRITALAFACRQVITLEEQHSSHHALQDQFVRQSILQFVESHAKLNLLDY